MDKYFSEYSDIFLKNKLNDYVNQEMSQKFSELSRLLVEENKKYNLTAIKEERQILPLHFADCLIGSYLFKKAARVIDVGCGAGFPTLPLAIVRPDLDITAVDSTEKKLEFIKTVCEKLGLKNVKTLHGRAEELAVTELRESFDVACARAVARLNILSELCLPFVKLGGLFVALKGAIGREEYTEAAGGIRELGGGEAIIVEKTLYVSENESQNRVIVTVEKDKNTPSQYPRMYSRIKKKPL